MEVFICQRNSRIHIGKWDGWFEPLSLLKLIIMTQHDREVWRESIRNERVWKRFDSISGFVAKQLLLGTTLWKKNTMMQGAHLSKKKLICYAQSEILFWVSRAKKQPSTATLIEVNGSAWQELLYNHIDCCEAETSRLSQDYLSRIKTHSHDLSHSQALRELFLRPPVTEL